MFNTFKNKNMRVKCIVVSIFILLFSSCKTTEYITKIETKTDTLKVEKTIIDTIFQERKIEVTKEVKSNVFLPCPDQNDTGISGSNQSGENHAKWEYDEDKGGYNIELYCAEQMNVKDSINRLLTAQLEVYKSSNNESTENVQKVKEKSFWEKLIDNIYKVLFVITLILWLFELTPKKIIRKIF